MQFPPWFHYAPKNLDHLVEGKEILAGLDLAIEFRHGSWLTPARADQALSFLKTHGLTYIVADEPQYGNLATVPFIPAVTTDTAYFRLHGRNKNTWLARGIETSLRSTTSTTRESCVNSPRTQPPWIAGQRPPSSCSIKTRVSGWTLFQKTGGRDVSYL